MPMVVQVLSRPPAGDAVGTVESAVDVARVLIARAPAESLPPAFLDALLPPLFALLNAAEESAVLQSGSETLRALVRVAPTQLTRWCERTQSQGTAEGADARGLRTTTSAHAMLTRRRPLSQALCGWHGRGAASEVHVARARPPICRLGGHVRGRIGPQDHGPGAQGGEPRGEEWGPLEPTPRVLLTTQRCLLPHTHSCPTRCPQTCSPPCCVASSSACSGLACRRRSQCVQGTPTPSVGCVWHDSRPMRGYRTSSSSSAGCW